MKKSVVLLLSCLITAQSFASDFSLKNMQKELMACKTTLVGCTAEQELNIASYNGLILDSYDLEKYLVQDKEKSFFIPLSLNNQELLTLAAATSLGIVAFKNDQELMNVVQNHKSKITPTIATVGNFLGSAPAGVAIAAGSYFMGVYYENDKLKKVGLFIVGSNLASTIAVGAAKVAFGRARPRTGQGPYSFFTSDGKSFYSGHTSQAFSVATVIAEMYKEDYPVVPYVAYGIAAITGYARMHDNAHWAADVITGAVAGHLITKLALNIMQDNKDSKSGVEIYPGMDSVTGNLMIFLEYKGKQPNYALKCAKMADGFKKTEDCLAEAFENAKKHK
jgi:membrane-associated phospholipid phosphatase